MSYFTSLLFTLFCFLTTIIYAQERAIYQLFFKSDSTSLTVNEQLKFKGFIKTFDTVTISNIHINGYCDDEGSEFYNQKLSTKRAEFIAGLMPNLNYEKIGKGEIQLKNTMINEEERSQNRRVDVIIEFSAKDKSPEIVIPKTEVVEIKPTKVKPIISDTQKVGDKITLENILFIGGRHALLPESYEAINILTSTLLEHKKYHIQILGHVCCIRTGNDGIDYDTGQKNLSVARARVIYDYLILKGIDTNRLSYKGMKAEFPTGKGDKEDRRVEIEITKIVNK